MHFQLISVIVTISVGCATPVLGNTANAETTIKAFGNVDKNALRGCLDSYRTDNWDGKDCGGRGWFKGHWSTYNSPQNCYDACYSGIRAAIDAGASDVECDDYEGLTRCWMGYH